MIYASSGGSRKSAEIEGKSFEISVGSSAGFSEDRDRKYSFSPASAWSTNVPNNFDVYLKFLDLKSIWSVVASCTTTYDS